MTANDMDLVQRALEEFGREIGAEIVDGEMIVPFNGFFDCTLRADREGDVVVLETALTLIPDERRDATLRKAMLLDIDPAQVADGVLFLDAEDSVLTLRTKKKVGTDGARALKEAFETVQNAAHFILAEIFAAKEDRASPPTTAAGETILRA